LGFSLDLGAPTATPSAHPRRVALRRIFCASLAPCRFLWRPDPAGDAGATLHLRFRPHRVTAQTLAGNACGAGATGSNCG
jgi:hypothetical protein